MFYLMYNLTVIFCGVPPPVLRGEYNYTGLKNGDTVSYNCEPGYDLHGIQSLTCDCTGNWGQRPCCISE